MSEPKVKIRILSHVGRYSPGQVVEVSAEEAKTLCEKKVRNGGGTDNLISYQHAISVAEWEAAQNAPLDVGGFSQGDMVAMGAKGAVTVHTPVDRAFEKKLAAAKGELDKADLERTERTAKVRKKVDETKAKIA